MCIRIGFDDLLQSRVLDVLQLKVNFEKFNMVENSKWRGAQNGDLKCVLEAEFRFRYPKVKQDRNKIRKCNITIGLYYNKYEELTKMRLLCTKSQENLLNVFDKNLLLGNYFHDTISPLQSKTQNLR